MFVGKNVSCFEASKDAGSVSNERDVGAFTFNVSFSKRDKKISIGWIRDLSRVAVKSCVFHDVNRIVITDRGFHHSFGIGWGGRRADLEAGESGEEALGSV